MSEQQPPVHIPAGLRDRGPDPRTVRTRAAVAEAATTLFLRNGYADTGVDEIAALAKVSKRSIYNNYGDKESLFTELVLGFTTTAGEFAEQLVGGLTEAADLPQALHALGRRHLATVARPEVLRLRRLIILEATRFPALADEYYRRAPGRVMAALTEAFTSLHARGALRAPNARRAAEHFSYLVLGSTLDAFLFAPEAQLLSPDELDRLADDGVSAFLAAYGS
ncbi:TetR/AcrR family transcriptional regulator [Streptacidiphilus pinicola]|uniref:TetR/AcrR family transcriptional regulator n=1 Tax=Streptacidiphilus pinicola TaxID=2219663 RepID=A0A2X0IC35_9ACTN|nr:TetR/AcrR family transcriptional regulator [Streptacidiphilus pinicola]RAG81153.1 TetR/AcrR family transcriptional regulator [Streptacidiphilus pinicola]